MPKLIKVLLLVFLLNTLSSCGNTHQDSSSAKNDVLPTEIVDERDHSSEIPNDPKFEESN